MTQDAGPGVETVLNALDGDVQAQGIKLDHRQWLDAGSEDYARIADDLKAAAWQAALVRGWDEDQIKSLMLQQYPHLDEQFMSLSIKNLKELSEKYPFEVEQLYDPEEQIHETAKAEPGTLGSND